MGGIAVTGTAGGAGGGVEGAWGAPASPSRGALGGGGGAGVGQAGDAGGGTLPAIRQGAAGAGETGGAWEAGDDGMVEEESSLDMPSAAGEAAGGSSCNNRTLSASTGVPWEAKTVNKTLTISHNTSQFPKHATWRLMCRGRSAACSPRGWSLAPQLQRGHGSR